MTNSTISYNRAGLGGGIDNEGGTLTITNSTISNNEAYDKLFLTTVGGGISNYETLILTNCTIAENTAEEGGNGIYNRGPATLMNVIIANNFPGNNCGGYISLTSLGHNLDNDGTRNLTHQTDLPNTNPLIGPLMDNGGSTLTHAPLLCSPVIDKGDSSNCPPADQRGINRPQDGNAYSIAVCDIGAVEFFTPIKPGDIDGNFSIEVQDAVLTLQLLSNIATSAQIFKEADINCDGIGIAEALFTLQVTSGLKSQP